MNHPTKTYDATVKADKAERTFSATISTQAIDRDNEVLLSRGLRASEFLKNPVVFWNHNYDVPIGKARKVMGEPDRVRAVAQMAERPNDHDGEWFPDTVLSLMDQGVIRGVSVGFQSIETRRPTAEDKAKFGDNVSTIHSKWNLLEFSVVSIPANAEALIDAVDKGILSTKSAKRYFDIPGDYLDERLKKRRRKVSLYVCLPPKPRLAAPTKSIDDMVLAAFTKRAGRLEY